MISTNENKEMLLIANLTHQAINPLNGVIGTLDNVIKGVVPEKKKEQRINSARSQLEYTVSLLRNLAYFAQYSGDDVAGYHAQAKEKTCVIPQVIIESMMFFQEQASTARIALELENPADQYCVKGDPDLLRQVFMNIFDNSVKYGQPDSMVNVKDWIQKKTGDMIITIEGEGVSFDVDENIFALGTRGKNAEVKTSSGSGLGLYICRLIVEKLFNGSIDAQCSGASIGKVLFTIRLPGAFTMTKG
jgi:signal transduction histidine kinase